MNIGCSKRQPDSSHMNKCETELLFPSYLIPTLTETRGEKWQLLVKEVNLSEEDSLEIMAFTLTMARTCNCVFCNSSSYRAMQGCRQCARQALNRFRGSDDDLVDFYNAARIEVENFLEKKNKHE